MKAGGDFQVRGWMCSYSRFTSAELEAITGLPGPMQRLWRSRSQLPGEIATRAAFSTRDVAEIMVRHDLSKLGISPGDSSDLGRDAAQTILWFAFLNADGAVEITGAESRTEEFVAAFEGDGALVGELCDHPKIMRYIIKAALGDPAFSADLASCVEKNRMRSAAFLDLEMAAHDLAVGACRPLLRVDVGTCKGERQMRRLTRIPHPSLQSL